MPRSLPALLLRAEGLVVFGAALAIYLNADFDWWPLVAFGLAPDLAIVAYSTRPRAGAAASNAVHTYVGPLILGGAGLLADARLPVQIALIWAAHSTRSGRCAGDLAPADAEGWRLSPTPHSMAGFWSSCVRMSASAR